MHKKQSQDMPAVGKAILAGNVEEVRALLNNGSILFKKGKTVCLKRNIPQTYELNGKEQVLFSDAFGFALAKHQTEIVKLLVDSGVVDMKPGSDALFMVIRSGNSELFAYMVEKGAQIEKDERGVTRLFLNLMDVWDDAYLPIIEGMDLPLKECGGQALCYAAGDNHMALVKYLLSAGVSVDCKGNGYLHNTPVLCAAEGNHFEMVKYLVERGADLSEKNAEGIRPYLAAQQNKNAEMKAYIKEHESAELHSEEMQDKLFDDYHVPKAMAEYFRNGNLTLEFPEEKKLHWIRLYAYMDVPEMSYQGKKVLSLVEDSEDYGVMLVWEPRSKKIWFIDMEHEIFHAVSSWSKFIQNPGRYTNRAIMWDFD